MSIPELTEHGLLPEGIHDCTIDEIQEVFSSENPESRRSILFNGLLNLLNYIKTEGVFSSIYVNGSFTTGKKEPNDVDVVLELPRPKAPLPVILTNSEYIKRTYHVDIHWIWLGYPSPRKPTMLEEFQKLRIDDAIERGLGHDARKGILKVKL